ncbi:hypothetical protein GH714_015599 [Hevea brasiliensis]|uniref:Uncharacterized protein n=1 Tax=Hevea brasiliensis TaxID=3981 RepID=A0A6A6N489_HEVBR|nr:hypothetical protein GH714_015599 [Hevea brasiliensis]
MKAPNVEKPKSKSESSSAPIVVSYFPMNSYMSSILEAINSTALENQKNPNPSTINLQATVSQFEFEMVGIQLPSHHHDALNLEELEKCQVPLARVVEEAEKGLDDPEVPISHFKVNRVLKHRNSSRTIVDIYDLYPKLANGGKSNLKRVVREVSSSPVT